MHQGIAEKRAAMAALCRRFGMVRLEVFADFQAALEALLRRPVDLVERPAIEASRNYIRRGRIPAEAEAVYAG